MKRRLVLGIWAIACFSGESAAQESVVLLDAAHHNIVQPTSRSSLIRMLAANGYRSRELHEAYTPSVLNGVQLVIVEAPLSDRNALPDSFTQAEFNRAWRRPVPSAFSESEIQTLSEWVSQGGGLLLVFDHMPLAGASQSLAAAFGFHISDGFAVNPGGLQDLSAPSVAEAGSIVFYRSAGTLADHAVTSGQLQGERIDSIATWTGSAFRAPRDAVSLLTLGPSFVSLLPDTAWVFSESTPQEDIGGWSQGALLEVGQGRVALFAELGVLVTAEIVSAFDREGGANPQVQNPQLLLNVLRWLSGGI